MPGGPSTKERIRSAAAQLFLERGFERTSVRQIAAEANADPSLVIRHFGSKELLFLETMEMTLDDSVLLMVPLHEFGRAFVTFLLRADEATRGVFLAFVRGSAELAIAERLRAAHDRLFVTPLRDRLDGRNAEERARLAAALVAGLLYSMWVVGDEVLLAADHDELAERYGGLLQELLTPDR